MPVHFAPSPHRHAPAYVDRRLRRRAIFSCFFLAIAAMIAYIGVIFPADAAGVPGLRIVPDTRPLMPTVILRGIENGELVGVMKGEMRLFLGDRQVIPDGSGAFRVPADILRTDVRTVDIPEGMRFVASKKGKRYYPVQSKQAESLAPKNRLYFRSEEEAKAAGYR